MSEKTRDRLAWALENIGLKDLAAQARAGLYDEFDSPLPYPLTQLVAELTAHGAYNLAARVADGEFEATKEEADAWFEREGRYLFEQRCSRA